MKIRIMICKKLISTDNPCKYLNFVSFFLSLEWFIKGININCEIANKIATNNKR